MDPLLLMEKVFAWDLGLLLWLWDLELLFAEDLLAQELGLHMGDLHLLVEELLMWDLELMLVENLC